MTFLEASLRLYMDSLRQSLSASLAKNALLATPPAPATGAGNIREGSRSSVKAILRRKSRFGESKLTPEGAKKLKEPKKNANKE